MKLAKPCKTCLKPQKGLKHTETQQKSYACLSQYSRLFESDFVISIHWVARFVLVSELQFQRLKMDLCRESVLQEIEQRSLSGAEVSWLNWQFWHGLAASLAHVFVVWNLARPICCKWWCLASTWRCERFKKACAFACSQDLEAMQLRFSEY